MLAERLHKQGFRLTTQRLTILAVLDEADGHLTATQVYQLAKIRYPSLTEPTIYRTLDFLSRQGLALVTHIGNGHLVYESARHNHLHIACQRCGQVISLDYACFNEFCRSLENMSGFRLDTSHFTFLGTCPACQDQAE